MPNLITIFGATGTQGRSVLHSLSRNPTFTLRALTRNPTSPSAAALSSLNIEIVRADGWDTASLIRAFAGSWAVFANTNSDDAVFENPEEKRTEFDLGKNIVDAAVAAGVGVLVYSGMASARESSRGKVGVRAFDEKHAIATYATSTRSFKTVTIVSPGWYFENFLSQDLAPVFGGFPYFPADDGVMVFRVPLWGGREDVPFIAIGEDYGDLVHGVLLETERWDGCFVQGVSDVCSFGDLVGVFERATGKKARFEPIPNWQDLEVYGIRALETVKRMFGFCQESGGRYFGVQTEMETAKELKRKAALACGKVRDEAELLTLEKFFRREFGGK